MSKSSSVISETAAFRRFFVRGGGLAAVMSALDPLPVTSLDAVTLREVGMVTSRVATSSEAVTSREVDMVASRVVASFLTVTSRDVTSVVRVTLSVMVTKWSADDRAELRLRDRFPIS